MLFLSGMILKRKGGKTKKVLTMFFNGFFNEMGDMDIQCANTVMSFNGGDYLCLQI